MGIRAKSGLFAFVVASLLNPAVLTGCARLGWGYDFGEKEVLAMLDAAGHAGPYAVHDRRRNVEVSFDITQAAAPATRVSWAAARLVPSAFACDHRTFVRSAEACIDETTVPLVGTMTIKTPGGLTLIDRAPVTGELRVHGTHLGNAYLSLVGGPNGIELDSRDGKVFNVRSLTWNAPDPASP